MALPSGPATVTTIGTIATSGGQDGLGTSLGDTQLVVTLGFQGGTVAVVAVTVDDKVEDDVNCDGGVTAADLPALAQSVAGGDGSACFADDLNGDGTVDEDDVDALVDVVFGF